MRIFKGLDNIHAVIDRHESEWRKENGEPEPRTPDKVAEAVRQRLAARPDTGSGRFDEERFSRSGTPAKKKAPEAPVITPESTEPSGGVKLSADRFMSVNSGSENVTANEPEAVEIVRNQEGRHSWLYNEVMKAINDAAKGTSAKIIAVFVPVVQNSKEFEDLPADETVTASPIDISLAKIEAPENTITPEPLIIPEGVMPAENESPSEDLNLIPEIPPEQKAEIAETLKEMEEKFDEVLQEEKESESEPEILTDEPEPEIIAEELAPAVFADESESETPAEESAHEILTDEPEPEIIAEELAPAVLIDESESETPAEESAHEILTDEPEPEIIAEELAPAVLEDDSESETPEKESEPEISEDESDNDIFTEELSQAITTPEPEYETDDESDILQDGEPMDFEVIDNASNDSGHEELSLTDELDDDEIFDESITEIRRPDDDKALTVDGDGLIIPTEDDDDEIEIIPDPER